MSAGDLAGLPGEVAAVRARLTALRESLDPGAPALALPGPAGGRDRPAVAVLAAPGRGRRALVAALLGIESVPAATRRVRARDDGESPPPESPAPGTDGPDLVVDVPLLAEFDLLLPEPGDAAPSDTSAVLAVVGAGAPLDRHEVALLAAAARRTEHVLVALVGTDAHRGWRTVLAAGRELAAEAVPRLRATPWFPLAPTLAVRARDLARAGGDPDVVRAVDAAAGLAPLRAALHDLVARRRRMLDEANALRVLATALHAWAARASAPTPGPRSPAVPAPPETAARRRERHLRWRTGLAQARLAATDDLTARTRALAATLRAEIDTGGRGALDAVPERLAVGLDAAVTAVVAGLADQLRALVAATLADLVGPEVVAGLALPPPRPVSAPEGSAPAGAVEDRLLVVAGAVGGLGASRLALLPLLAAPLAPVAVGATVGAAALPVSAVVGIGVAGWMVRARRTAAGRARRRAWVAETLVAARADVERSVAESLVVADREVSLALDAALDAAAVRHPPGSARPDTRAARARKGAAEAEALLARLAALTRGR